MGVHFLLNRRPRVHKPPQHNELQQEQSSDNDDVTTIEQAGNTKPIWWVAAEVGL